MFIPTISKQGFPITRQIYYTITNLNYLIQFSYIRIHNTFVYKHKVNQTLPTITLHKCENGNLNKRLNKKMRQKALSFKTVQITYFI